MSELRTAQRMDAGAERIDIKRKSLSAEGKLRVALEAMACGADIEALARQHRVSAEEVARWRALAGDAALIALRNDRRMAAPRAPCSPTRTCATCTGKSAATGWRTPC